MDWVVRWRPVGCSIGRAVLGGERFRCGDGMGLVFGLVDLGQGPLRAGMGRFRQVRIGLGIWDGWWVVSWWRLTSFALPRPPEVLSCR